MIKNILRGLAPVAAAALMAGCGAGVGAVGSGNEGVPLAQLDTSGEPPSRLTLAGPDSIVVTDGPGLSIDVEGDADAIQVLRFHLEQGALEISREQGSRARGRATVRVAMPSPRAIAVAGSGRITAQSMAPQAKVDIAGSGRLEVTRIEADALEVNVVGSGTFSTAGRAEALELDIAGSGDVQADNLEVGTADVNIMGSGDATFSSDGTVDGKIMGSGDITVTGSATCRVTSMGSGSITCRPKATASE